MNGFRRRQGLVVTAGFWNSHVHILLLGLVHAEKLSSEQITSQLQQILTRWGFTTVFDVASVLQNTIAKGLDADLVVLNADPAQNSSAFSKVRYTIRGGDVIYAEK